jgi:hypothetical protein
MITMNSFFNEKDHLSFKRTKIPIDFNILESWVSKMNNNNSNNNEILIVSVLSLNEINSITFIVLDEKAWNNE